MCIYAPVAADEQIDNCEIVVQVQTKTEQGSDDSVEETVQSARFLPADAFIFSVFGAKPHLTEIDGQPIRAVLCTRTSLVPSEFDLKMIRTGIPFYLSFEFDRKDSPYLGINKTDKGYSYNYAGPNLSASDAYLLKLRMKALNNVKN